MRIGTIVMTSGVAGKVADNELFAKQVQCFLELYLQKDWGNVPEEDKEMNDYNAEMGTGSLMGAYNSCEGRIWIMTDHDRSATTVLFPSEY